MLEDKSEPGRSMLILGPDAQRQIQVGTLYAWPCCSMPGHVARWFMQVTKIVSGAIMEKISSLLLTM